MELACSTKTPETTIIQGGHESEFTPDMVEFTHGEMLQRVRDGFRVLLPEYDAVQEFREVMKLLVIATVTHKN